MLQKMKTKVFLDYASTTPIRPEVLDVMNDIYLSKFGNASSGHQMGREGSVEVNSAIQLCKESIRCPDHNIVFTSGGTESNNLAIKGIVESRGSVGRPNIVVSAIEHDSVWRTAHKVCQDQKVELRIANVNSFGLVDKGEMARLVDENTILVSVMHSNNEVGTIQPISGLVQEAKKKNPSVVFHSDIVQSIGEIEVDIGALGVDMFTLTAHKFGGPSGIGVLGYRKSCSPTGQLSGGGQQFDLRSGTLPVPLIAGLANALQLSTFEQNSLARKLLTRKNRLLELLMREIPGIELNGVELPSLPNILSVRIAGVDSQDVAAMLGTRGYMVSTGSACHSGKSTPSRVLLALGLSEEDCRSTIRISHGLSLIHI